MPQNVLDCKKICRVHLLGGIGGKGGTYERRLDTVECLDLTVPKGKWKLLASMSTSRSSHTVEVLDGKIYVVGKWI